MSEQDPAFSRSVFGGKRTAKCEARINDEVKMDLQRTCHELDMSESDYIERLVRVSLYGLDHVLSMERARTLKVCGLSVGALQQDSKA